MRPLLLAGLVPLALALALTSAACGGKIADDPDAGAGGTASSSGGSSSGSGGLVTPEPAPPRQQEQPPSSPSAPAPSGNSGKGSVADACETICHRDAQCGAWQSDCNDHCENEINSAAACSPQANAYIHCYADNIEEDSCSALPPICEPAYCAYARCAGRVVPSYCR